MADFDVIVIGSGFGGGTVACRLAEAGASVLVLERGRLWTPETFPRAASDPWLYDAAKPLDRHGWFELRLLKGMAVIAGAGVGGGSLSYANVMLRADADCFAAGWPEAIGAETLAPYYRRAEAMLGVNRIPEGQLTARARLLERAARAYGLEDRYDRVPLAVSFDPDFSYETPDAIDAARSKRFTNAQGREQGTCVHLGNCQVGCEVLAKNSVDLTYLARAEGLGAEIRPLHIVRTIEPDPAGYLVRWERIGRDGLSPGGATGTRVVVACGSLGSTELLLRCRDVAKTLPRIGPALGRRWSPNANFLTPAVYPDGVRVDQSIGPHITSGLDLMDGYLGGQRLYIEDDGFPDVILNALRDLAADLEIDAATPLAGLLQALLAHAPADTPLRQTMMWLGTGVDAGDGRLALEEGALTLDWDVRRSRPVLDAIVTTHRRLSEVEHGEAKTPLYWEWLKQLVTVHPLGGCAMADRPEEGVVDHSGEVFGHPNLFVVDGATVPTPIGRNPALTIAALAERSAELMAAERA